MPTFETPDPISLDLDFGAGEVEITASERGDTAVEVRPSDENDESDVQAAAQISVDYARGQLRIAGPKARAFDFSRKSRSVHVTVGLPTDSRVSTHTQSGDVHAAGRLGEVRVKTSVGNVRMERTGPLHVDTSTGHVSVEGVAGNAEISTGSGKVQLGEVQGSTTVKNSNGATNVDAAHGDVRVRAANGEITIGRAGAGVDVKTSNGEVRLGEVVRGSVVLETAMGDLEVGLAAGTAAYLDVDTGFGHVRNQLESTNAPDDTDERVEVRGRTGYGDVTIRRS